MSTLGRFAAGLALKGLLRKATGRAEPASTPEGAAAIARARRSASGSGGTVANPSVRRGAAFLVMMGSIAIALPLMLFFESTPTRIFGVLGLASFIVAGVFAIADPGFLESDDEESR
jgi:hypothetical protein